MTNLSEDIYDFLIDKNWSSVHETEYYIYFNPPEIEVTFNGDFLIKLPKDNLSKDYHFLIDKLIQILELIYNDRFKRKFIFFKRVNALSQRRYLTKKDWILPEEKSKVEKIGIDDIYVPNRY